MLMTLTLLFQNGTLFRNKIIKDMIRYDEVIVEKSTFLINTTSAFSRRQIYGDAETLKRALEDRDREWRQTDTSRQNLEPPELKQQERSSPQKL